ncbi:hypothetical protein [Dyadobacter sp.]|uniref:hypothetical protein n=1 Tax=Dyadobacter sp. TaxID=1914288 RepID=UPI003F70644B
MRKILLLGLLGTLYLAGNAHAQLQKGTRHWGTTVSFSGDNALNKNFNKSEYSRSQFTIAPQVQTGWFFADNKMFGLRLTPLLSTSKNNTSGQNYNYDSKTNYLSFSLSPFIRHYKSLSPKWAIFLHSGIDLMYTRNSFSDEERSEADNGYGGYVYINPGITFWVTPRFVLESDLNVLSLRAGYSQSESEKGFGVNAGVTSSISQYFGLRAAWYLQSK